MIRRDLQDMTTGSPTGLLLRFSFPLMAANALQQLYTIVDMAIIGRGVGMDALAAVGTADWLNWMLLNIIQGLTAGYAILFAQQLGARDSAVLRRAIASAALLSAVAAAVLTAISQWALLPALRLAQTPEGLLDDAALYLRVLFGGLPFLMMFNFSAAILRALGDSKTPFYSMLFASVFNLGLDLLFVLSFRWGIAGAAGASVLAQGAATIVNLLRLRRLPLLQLTRKDFCGWSRFVSPLMSLGTPLALQNAIIALGSLAVQIIVNRFAIAWIAGYTAAVKLLGLLQISSTSYGYAISTYVGQNFGAANHARIRSGVRAACLLSLATAAAFAAVGIFFAPELIGLFLPRDVAAQTGEALAVGKRLMTIHCLWLPVLYLMIVFRSSLQGLGRVRVPMLSGFFEVIIRIFVVWVIAAYTPQAVYYCHVAAWAGAAVVNGAACFAAQRKWCAAPSPAAPAASD